MYRTPDGNSYPSVTTVLSILPKKELEEWKARVGEEEAERVSKRATNRGTLIHQCAEDYLNNRLDLDTLNPMVLNDFLPIKKFLDEHIDDVISTEIPLYSDKLKAAGTGDLFASYDGKRSYIDFKTSTRLKYESEIEGYFTQESVYCCMIYEMYGIVVPNIVTVMAVDGSSMVDVFVKKTMDYLERFISIRMEFRKRYGI